MYASCLTASISVENTVPEGTNGHTVAEVAVIVLVDVDVVIDGVMVVAVLAAAAVVVVVVMVIVCLVSRVVMYLVMFVNESRPNHFQVTQSQLIQLAVGRCSQNYDSTSCTA